ncbi:hypothetical protein WCLP8_5250004 [uncultured Gammaproteobacteria bacterium]
MVPGNERRGQYRPLGGGAKPWSDDSDGMREGHYTTFSAVLKSPFQNQATLNLATQTLTVGPGKADTVRLSFPSERFLSERERPWTCA